MKSFVLFTGTLNCYLARLALGKVTVLCFLSKTHHRHSTSLHSVSGVYGDSGVCLSEFSSVGMNLKGRRVLPQKLGGCGWPTSQNPYPFYGQNFPYPIYDMKSSLVTREKKINLFITKTA